MQDFSYTVKTSSRAKRLTLKIKSDGTIHVTIPKGVNRKEADKFVYDKASWIKKTLADIPERKNLHLKTGTQIPYLGGNLTLYIRPQSRSNPRVEIVSESLIIFIAHDHVSNQEIIRSAITRKLKKEFRELIHESLEEYNNYYNFKYNRVAVKDNATNWGSCSSKGNLNFTWRLIFAPLEILDYVVVHELCHLKEQNHSQRFWDLVAEQVPDYKKKRIWLKKHGANLYF